LKSFIVIFILLGTSLLADSKIYFGVNYAQVNEKFSNLEAESSSDALKIKAGYGNRDGYGIELSVESVQNESKIFSLKDSQKNALNIELVKAFDYDIYIIPFVKAGFGAGYIDIDRELQDRLHFGSFNGSVGTFIPINENFDFEVEYNYKDMSYESIDMVVDELKIKSNVNTFYIGFNIRY
jgi:opacity protein-like surface antigen